jgi:hypothetical protein
MNARLGWAMICLLQAACPEGVFADLATGSHHPAPVKLSSPKAVRQAFEATEVVTRDTGWLKVPAIVADTVFVRGMEITPGFDPEGGNAEHVLNTYALNRAGVGRWFTFVAGHDMVERMLVDGQYAASRVFADLGYGSSFRCRPDNFYWLTVFKRSESVKPIPAVYYRNLQAWFNHVFKSGAPKIDPDILEKLESRRFQQITGCPVDESGRFDNRKLDQCNPEFSSAVKALWANNKCANPTALKYQPGQGCPTDAVLGSFGKQPGDRQLRAYLYAVGSFNEFYTGYGYTANAYNDPIAREYWTDNRWIRNLPKVELLRVQCDVQAGVATTSTGDNNEPRSSPFVERY